MKWLIRFRGRMAGGRLLVNRTDAAVMGASRRGMGAILLIDARVEDSVQHGAVGVRPVKERAGLRECHSGDPITPRYVLGAARATGRGRDRVR